MSARFRTILADPPWLERGGGRIKRGADRWYPLLKTSAIAALPVRDLIHEDGAHLWMWVTNNFLPDAFVVAAGWGFPKYVTIATWAKGEGASADDLEPEHGGLGQYLRGVTEQLLLFRTEKALPYKRDPVTGKRMQGSTLIIGPRGEHSEKPPAARAQVERVSHEPRIELFARETTPGWSVWGNEVKSDVALDSPPEPAQAVLL